MYSCVRRPALTGVLALGSLLAIALSGPARSDPLSMRVNGWTNPPLGYSEFCRTAPEECERKGTGSIAVLDSGRWQELVQLNSIVNRIIQPATDLAIYSQEEVWTLPEAYGDCEDYVLLKRKLLMDRGWPTGMLLIAVVFDEVGDGHAVLLVRTDRGDLVLDNKTDRIRPWQETAYRYVKRQWEEDPNRWVTLGDPRWTTRSTATNR